MNNTRYIKKVLLCKPSYFQVNYSINPWMQIGKTDRTLAMLQWQKLCELLEKQSVKVEIIDQDPNFPDMVFAADQALTSNNKVVFSNFRFDQRKSEVNIYKKWFDKQNYNQYKFSGKKYFEGSGDSLWFNDKLLLGTGFRNSQNICRDVSEFLNVETICLKLVNPHFYHLDTCLFILNRDTAFYYPPAFSKQSRNTLKKLIPNLIQLNKQETHNFAANSIVTDHHVITQTGNPEFCSKLSRLGYKVLQTDVSEFNKAGGGIHCLIQTVEEEYA